MSYFTVRSRMITHKKFWIFIWIWIISFASVMPPLLCIAAPTAENGILDLSKWDFKMQGVISLKGQWKFYWNRFVLPTHDGQEIGHGKEQVIIVPSAWEYKGIDGAPISGKGFATYHLQIILPGKQDAYAIHIPEASTAYSLYVDGKHRITVGKPGKNKIETVPRYESTAVTFSPEGNKTEVVFWLSNFHHRTGGLWEEIRFGPVDQMYGHRLKRSAMDLSLFGAILIFGIYHLVIYGLRMDERYSFFFTVFCLLMALRILVTGERYLLNIVPSLPWILMIKIEYLTFYLGSGAFVGFYYYLFPSEFKRGPFIIAGSLSILFSLIVILFPASIFTWTLTAAQVTTIIVLSYALISLFISIKRGRLGAKTFLFGLIVFFLTVINDILHARGIINSIFIFHFGMFAFVVSQGTIIARKYAQAFKTVKQQGAELVLKHQALNKELNEREKAEIALRNSEQRFRNLAELLPGAVFDTDIHGKVTFFNRAAKGFLNIDEISGCNQADLMETVVPSEKKGLEARFREVIKKGENIDLEVTAQKADGTEFPVILFMNRVAGPDGEPRGVRGVAIDITARKEMEKRLRNAEKMESIGTLSGGIAHEFNNILAIILGNSELAMDDIPPHHPAYENLSEICDASIRGKEIIMQLLRFSKDSEENMELADIGPVLEKSLKFLGASIPSSVKMRYYISDKCHMVMANTIQIEQIVLNLCSNAVDAMQASGGSLEVRLENVDMKEGEKDLDPGMQGGQYVRLSVIDTGSGIPNPDIDRIFDPYFTTKDIDKGTGLGLAVVHGIVANHGASIRVHSTMGEGTSFNIFFPASNSGTVRSNRSDKHLPGGNENILFVDDEASIVNIQSKRLKRLGYNVESFQEPGEALKCFRSMPDRFDLVITDMTMPDMTGDRLIIRILRQRPDIPTILCTGHSDIIDKTYAEELGIDAYLMKPIDKATLARTVRKVLGKA